MRVISGSSRGTRLKTIESMDTRPTTDRVKESLFNLIQSQIYGRKVLDLFSGSGSLGIEALSRGATFAVFVDNSRKCVSVIRENLEKTKLINRSEILNFDIDSALNKLSMSSDKFGLIILDPPYNKGFIIPVLKTVSEKKLLDNEGIIVIEHEKNDILGDELFSFKKVKSRDYGITTISIFKEEALCE